MEVKGKDYDVTFRDPQPVLRKYRGNEHLIVTKFDCKPFTAAGDNYGSTLLKVHIVIKEDETSAAEQELNLVAKMLPPTKVQRAIFESFCTFKKEIFLYEHLIPTYAHYYERAFDDKFDITPAYYGSRLSLNNESCDVDENAVILMENLKLSGYYMGNRHQGLLIDEVKSAITALAKFHAVGFVVKKENPVFMDKCKLYTNPLSEIKGRREKILGPIMDAVKADPQLSRYAERIESSLEVGSIYGTHLDSENQWATIIHKDFWLNNMTVRRKLGKLDKVKMVDFQTYCYASPLSDLIFFLCTSMAMPLVHFDETIEFYRQTVVNILERMGHESSMFSVDQFENRLKIDANNELCHIMFISRAIQRREGEDLTKDPPNKHFMARIRRIVEIFVEKNWI